MHKIIYMLLINLIFCGILSGCYDLREVDDLAYVTAIGFDKGNDNLLKVTMQFALPGAAGGGGGESEDDGGGGSGNKSSSITTMEAANIYAALNMANQYISKQVNVSHAKLIVFSEELAKEGMHQYIHAIIRSREFRPNMYIAIARGTAEDYIKSAKPLLESNPTKYYEMLYKTYNYTALIPDAKMMRFYLQQECTCSQAIATLAGVGTFKSSADITENSSASSRVGKQMTLPGDFRAGDLPKTGESKAEVLGSAVFDGSHMIGELNGMETSYYLMVTGQYRHSNISITEPKTVDKFIILDIKQSRNPVRKVKMENGKPHIYVSLKLECDILSIQSGRSYESLDKISELEKISENYLRESITKFLYRTSKELNSDVCAFGSSIKGKFLTWKQWEDFKWLGRYGSSTFEVDVDVKVRRPGLMLRSLPAYSTKGEEMH